jgi:hypothetical protein
MLHDPAPALLHAPPVLPPCCSCAACLSVASAPLYLSALHLHPPCSHAACHRSCSAPALLTTVQREMLCGLQCTEGTLCSSLTWGMPSNCLALTNDATAALTCVIHDHAHPSMTGTDRQRARWIRTTPLETSRLTTCPPQAHRHCACYTLRPDGVPRNCRFTCLWSMLPLSLS